MSEVRNSALQADEIEVTPAMEQAGAEFLLSAMADRVPLNWPIAGVIAADLWRAVEYVRLAERRESLSRHA